MSPPRKLVRNSPHRPGPFTGSDPLYVTGCQVRGSNPGILSMPCATTVSVSCAGLPLYENSMCCGGRQLMSLQAPYVSEPSIIQSLSEILKFLRNRTCPEKYRTLMENTGSSS